jgi:hypothetical protein
MHLNTIHLNVIKSPDKYQAMQHNHHLIHLVQGIFHVSREEVAATGNTVSNRCDTPISLLTRFDIMVR